jgi:hypothetical protein
MNGGRGKGKAEVHLDSPGQRDSKQKLAMHYAQLGESRREVTAPRSEQNGQNGQNGWYGWCTHLGSIPLLIHL